MCWHVRVLVHMCLCVGAHVHMCLCVDGHVYMCLCVGAHVYMCLCVDGHVYMCLCVGAHVYMCLCVGAHVPVCWCTCACVLVHMCLCVGVHVPVCWCTCACVLMGMCACVLDYTFPVPDRSLSDAPPSPHRSLFSHRSLSACTAHIGRDRHGDQCHMTSGPPPPTYLTYSQLELPPLHNQLASKLTGEHQIHIITTFGYQSRASDRHIIAGCILPHPCHPHPPTCHTHPQGASLPLQQRRCGLLHSVLLQ